MNSIRNTPDTRQRGRAVETFSSVISLGAVVGITAWTCTIALSAGVI